VRQEWLLQDRAAIVAQLGLNVQEFARNLGVMQNQLGIARESAETLDARWAVGRKVMMLRGLSPAWWSVI
jgi:hypothetical protein